MQAADLYGCISWGDHAAPGMKQLLTDVGDPVIRIDKGIYELENGTHLRSDDPEAP